MADNKIIINGQEFPIHYLLLKAIANNLPDQQNYAPLGKALVGLGIVSITKDVLDSDLLDTPTMDGIWDLGNLELRRKLAGKSDFVKMLTDAQAREIMEAGDPGVLKSIALDAELLYPDESSEQACRLSGEMADALIRHIQNHPNNDVRLKLAENYRISGKFRPSFMESIKLGCSTSRVNYPRMTNDDIAHLPELPNGILRNMARCVENIKDGQVRRKVIDFLCAHPDPAVRMVLANNRWAPQYAMDLLENDADADVAYIARNRDQEDDDLYDDIP